MPLFLLQYPSLCWLLGRFLPTYEAAVSEALPVASSPSIAERSRFVAFSKERLLRFVSHFVGCFRLPRGFFGRDDDALSTALSINLSAFSRDMRSLSRLLRQLLRCFSSRDDSDLKVALVAA
jgi:hypothetical protein